MEANKTGNIRTTYKIRRVRKTTVAVKKQWVLHICLCVLVSVRVDLFIQHATRKRYAVSSAASLAPPYFSTLSHKRHDFRKKVTEHKMRVLIFSTTFISNISHPKKNSATYCHKCEKSFM
jgi:hypothetical protein